MTHFHGRGQESRSLSPFFIALLLHVVGYRLALGDIQVDTQATAVICDSQQNSVPLESRSQCGVTSQANTCKLQEYSTESTVLGGKYY